MSRVLASVLVAGLAVPQVALAAPAEGPKEPAGEAREDDGPPPVGTLSKQGDRRGAVELGLGTLMAGAAVGLAAFGAMQYLRAKQHVVFCRPDDPVIIDENTMGGPVGIDPCRFDPPPLGFASAGLSWVFAGSLLVGSGLLMVRGVRVLEDARRWQRIQLSLGPWWNRRGGGGSLALRF